MADLGNILAYLLTFLIPLGIAGYGSMIEEKKATIILAYVNMIAFMVYFFNAGQFAGWIIIVLLVILSFVFVLLYRGLIGSTV